MSEHKKKKEFNAHFIDIGPEIILIEMSGSVDSPEGLEKFKEFSEELDEEIKANYQRTHTKVNLLIDASDISVPKSYSLDVFKILEESATRTRNYDNKTAVYGANYALELLTDAISALSEHNNIRFFKTKEEAIEWLRE